MTGTDLYKRKHKSVLVIFEPLCTFEWKRRFRAEISNVDWLLSLRNPVLTSSPPYWQAACLWPSIVLFNYKHDAA